MVKFVLLFYAVKDIICTETSLKASAQTEPGINLKQCHNVANEK